LGYSTTKLLILSFLTLKRLPTKAAIAKETVLAYPDFSKLFEIYTDASATPEP
jgi:hypothetical protein